MATKITKNTKIAYAIAKHPEIIGIFIESGMHCIGCHVSAYETIEQGAKVHGLSGDDIENMVVKINKIIKNKK